MKFRNEQALLHRLQHGEERAVQEWYLSSKEAVLSFFLQRVSIEADAQELLQDTYLSCLASLPLFRGQSSFFSWMIGIARHELADYWRKKYAKKAIALLPFGQELLDTVDIPEHVGEKNEDLRELFAQLPSEVAELLALKYIDGRSIQELALQFGVSIAAMQSKLYRAKELFRKEYAQSMEAQE